MQLINQLGHLQHWGMSPAHNVLFRYDIDKNTKDTLSRENPIRILLSGCSDIRHLMKTVSDICQLKPQRPIHFYLHEIKYELLCRMMLQLHILHEQHLNFDERMELYLDLYGNALIKQKNARYLHNLRDDFLNFIHGEKKKSIVTPLKKFVKLDKLRFEQRDSMSEVVSSWSMKIPFDMQKLRDSRLRYLFGNRYDYRANLVDWDYNMILNEGAPIMHYYHYKTWRLRGLAFQNRFSTYTEPNRTLSSYAPGRKKQQKTSCLVRGYWGDIVISPYIGMGVHTDYPQKDLLFKKANDKYIGHSVQLTEYHMEYWMTMLEKMETYIRVFRDYYRTDQKGRQNLDQKDLKKKKQRRNNSQELKENAIEEKSEEDQQQKQLQKQKKQQQINEQQQIKEQQVFKVKEDIEQTIDEPQTQEKMQEKRGQQNQKQQQNEGLTLDLNSLSQNKKKAEQKTVKQDLDSDEQKQKQQTLAKDAKDIDLGQQQKPVLAGFEAVNMQVFPIGMSIENLTKAKYHEYFDIVVLGFIHSAFLKKNIVDVIKPGGQLHCQKPTFLIPKKKEERKELTENMGRILKEQKLEIQYENKFFFIAEKPQ